MHLISVKSHNFVDLSHPDQEKFWVHGGLIFIFSYFLKFYLFLIER